MSEKKGNVTYTYFLLDLTYNISHILSKFIDKYVNLIYLVFPPSEAKMFEFMYIQDCSLKHITRLVIKSIKIKRQKTLSYKENNFII